MALVLSQDLGTLPVGMVQQIVRSRVVLGRAVDDMDTVAGRHGQREHRPVSSLMDAAVNPYRSFVVRAEEQFLSLFALYTGVQVGEPEHWLGQPVGSMGIRPAVVSG